MDFVLWQVNTKKNTSQQSIINNPNVLSLSKTNITYLAYLTYYTTYLLYRMHVYMNFRKHELFDTQNLLFPIVLFSILHKTPNATILNIFYVYVLCLYVYIYVKTIVF